jgi:hypothetical protein
VVLQGTGAVRVEDSSVARLAEFFPNAIRVRIPVEIAVTHGNGEHRGKAVIEFGTAQEVLFTAEIALEFNDAVRLTNSDGSLDAAGKVVAVQFDGNRTVVAVRFDKNVANWIIKSVPSELGR